MKRFNVDLSLEDVARIKNALNPVDPQDYVTLAFLQFNYWQDVTYASGNVSFITFYNSASFITANRIYRVDLTYVGDLVTVETLKKYDIDGTTILKTYTWTHTYSADVLTSSSMVIT